MRAACSSQSQLLSRLHGDGLYSAHHSQLCCEQAVASLLRLRDLVKQFIARQDGERVSALLYAASNGDVSTVRQVQALCLLAHPCCVRMALGVSTPAVPHAHRGKIATPGFASLPSAIAPAWSIHTKPCCTSAFSLFSLFSLFRELMLDKMP